jgi:CBS domain-containing protein
MEFSIFFDYRTVFGDESIANELRNHIFKNVQQSPHFFTQVAQNALQFKSPARLFGIIVSSPGSGEGSQLIDLKATTMPIVSFSRLYSLHQEISETNTIARIDELVRKGIILPSKQEEIQTAFALLLRLRLRHQCAIIQSGGQPDNLVNPSSLGHIEEAILRECYNEIDLLQTRIRRDFLGGD